MARTALSEEVVERIVPTGTLLSSWIRVAGRNSPQEGIFLSVLNVSLFRRLIGVKGETDAAWRRQR
jgi:hypothetical protein